MEKTKLANWLEARNHLISFHFARRDPHPTDRSQKKLSLTPKGAAMTERV